MGSPLRCCRLSASCVLGAVFLRHSRRSPAPFIPVRLLAGQELPGHEHRQCRLRHGRPRLRRPRPLYAQNRYHLPLASAGTLLTARAIGTVCLAGLSAMMLRRTGCRLPMVVGFSAIALSLVMLAIEAPAGVPPYLWLAGWSLLTGLGMGVSTPATNNATLQLAPDQVAQIAGLRGMFRQSGGILSVSITTALLARSSNPGITQAYMFLVEAALIARSWSASSSSSRTTKAAGSRGQLECGWRAGAAQPEYINTECKGIEASWCHRVGVRRRRVGLVATEHRSVSKPASNRATPHRGSSTGDGWTSQGIEPSWRMTSVSGEWFPDPEDPCKQRRRILWLRSRGADQVEPENSGICY